MEPQIMPIVSVLMTSYNREDFIGEAIQSVLNSTFKDFELIICDDGSTDKTVEIARSFEKADPRVKVFINPKNLGDYPNRNQAASHATGKYLKYVDSDDLIYPYGLEQLVFYMEQFPEAEWGLCSLDQDRDRIYPFMLNPRELYFYNFFERGLFHKAPLSSIIKREFFNKVGGFKPIRMVGDYEMWHRLALEAPAVLMPGGIVWYREHGNQEVKDRKKYEKDYETIKSEFLNHPKCPLTKDEVQKVMKSDKRKRMKNKIITSLKSLLR